MADPPVAQWIYRAAEVEGLADVMSDPTAKRIMLMIAAGYHRLAEHAASQQRRERAAAGGAPQAPRLSPPPDSRSVLQRADRVIINKQE
jgi:hypothetical protein